MTHAKVAHKRLTDYRVFLKEEYRPPSRGGNTRARHAHVLTIDGETYSFLALGSQKWVYKTDTVSFEYETKDTYKNIIKETLVTVDAKGREVVRGNRGIKKRLRTAPTRLPGSRREQRD